MRRGRTVSVYVTDEIVDAVEQMAKELDQAASLTMRQLIESGLRLRKRHPDQQEESQ